MLARGDLEARSRPSPEIEGIAELHALHHALNRVLDAKRAIRQGTEVAAGID